MGRSRTFTYALHVTTFQPGRVTPIGWERDFGPATDAGLARFVADFEAATRPGGVNAHLGELTVSSATLVRQRDGAVVASYLGPRFAVVR